VFQGCALVGAMWGAGVAGTRVAASVSRDVDDLSLDARRRWKRRAAQ
jgi:hypothetical protein